METKKWGLWVLTAFVIGNMVGGGVFMLPANLAQVSGPMGYTGMEYYRTWRIYDCTRIWKFSNPKARIKSRTTKLCSSNVPFKKAGKVAGYSMAWDIGQRTGLQQHLLLFPLLDIYQHSFQFYKVSKFSFQRTDFTRTRKRINFPRM